MKNLTFLLLLLGLILSSGLLAAAEMKIGVLRFTDVVNKYDRTKDIQDDINARQEKLRQERDARANEIKQLTAKLQQNTPGSQAYTQTESELKQKQAEFKTWAEVTTEQLLDEEAGIIRDVYRDVEKAAAAFARANQYSLIIKEDDLDLLGVRANDLRLKIALRKVVYFDPALDVTDGVIKVLNANYAATRNK